MMHLTDRPIDVDGVLRAVQSSAAGAVVLFLGSVREMTDGRRTTALEYDCYPAMAEKSLAELRGEAIARWTLVECAVVHRLGRLEIGETSVAIAVAAPHRAAAFEAGQWLIDRIKEVVPVWKKELWADGTSEWVHPGLQAETPP
jgi:molybdopterin synthase catalytic subunit